MQYFFILGKNHLLSLAEIVNLLKYQKKNFTVSDLSSKVLILDVQDEFLPDLFLSRLGGTVKVGKIIKAQLNVNDLVKVIRAKPSGKINFGFSVYATEDLVSRKRMEDSRPRRVRLERIRFKIKDLSFKIKKELQHSGRSVRWVVSREKNLSSVIVKTNKLIENGAEIVLLVGRKDLLVGRTLAVQEFDEYSRRDYGREYRDAKSGLIPPKLAKIMINLANVNLNGIILDPFCGSGTVLQEALLMGYNQVIGSDISEKAVHNSKKNLEWLMDKYQMSNDQCLPAMPAAKRWQAGLPASLCEALRAGQMTNKIQNPKSKIINKSQIQNQKSKTRFPIFDLLTSNSNLRPTTHDLRPNYKIFQHDVQRISQIVGTETIDAIITEPYLGPNNLKHADIKRVSELGKVKKELSGLYLNAFQEFKKVLKPGGRVVMVWPVWQVGVNQWQNQIDENKLSYLPIINDVIKLGFRKINLLPLELVKQYDIKQNERNSLIYSRPNQMVLREILVWEKK